MRDPETYSETIRAPIWLRLVLAGVSLGALAALTGFVLGWGATDASLRWAVIALAGCVLMLVLVLLVCFGRMSLHADPAKVIVDLGLLRLLRTEIDWNDIASAKPVRFQPVRHFGGWGLRAGRYRGVRTVLYALRGAKGVLLVLKQPIETPFATTDHIIVGSQQPRQFAAYLAERLRA